MEASNSILFGGFTMEEVVMLVVFRGTGQWEKWAASHGVSKANKYIKVKLSYKGNSFDMVNLVGVADSSRPWDQTYDFFTLAALKAANLVQELDWAPYGPQGEPPTNRGVVMMTFTR
jgi:hypothetical protein